MTTSNNKTKPKTYTRNSSGQTVQSYQDDLGNTVVLDKELARGGEGRVCLVKGNPNVVAKLYLDKALKKGNKAQKIKAMCDLYDQDIAKFSALPQRVLFNSRNKIVGFIMEKISDFREIHELYGIPSKRVHFDYADWGFMVHAAKNLACAVDTLHNKSIVIGDINQGNILVNNQAMIKLIDCDSYQVEYNGNFYLCEVGVPEYTPPELQGKSFQGVQRTKNQDCFGLAVMIFKILFFGRHPYTGNGAPHEIEKAIETGHYCFSKSYQNKTPIYSTLFTTLLTDEIKDLFERAFSKKKNAIRPSASEWISALDVLEQNLATCSCGHKHYNNGTSCVWCSFINKKNPNKSFDPFGNKKTTLKRPKNHQTPYTPSVSNTPTNTTPHPSSSIPASAIYLNQSNTTSQQHIIIGFVVVVFAIAILSSVFNTNDNYSQYDSTPYIPSSEPLKTETVHQVETKSEQKKVPQPQTSSTSNLKDTGNKETSKQVATKKTADLNQLTPRDYLSQVKYTITSNYSTNASLDEIVIEVIPGESVKKIKTGWNDDIAANYLRGMLYSKLPKYYNSDGTVVPLLVTFSGYSITNVSFKYSPKTTTAEQKTTNTTSIKQNNITKLAPQANSVTNKTQTAKPTTPAPINKVKTDLEKSTDYFFE